MVFAGIFPTDSAQYEDLRDALSKLHMNDAAFVFEPDTSEALGFGFRCGFLGLLHMEIIQERLEREYDLDLITTAPSVVYHVLLNDGSMKRIENPAKLPAPNLIDHIEEPIFRMTVHVPAAYVGAVLALCQERRGEQKSIQYASSDRVIITYDMPLARGALRLPRPAEERLARLRLDGLRARRLPRGRPRQARHAGERRAARRAQRHRPPREGLHPRARPGREAEGHRPPPAVRGRHPGRDRLARSSPGRPSRRCART